MSLSKQIACFRISMAVLAQRSAERLRGSKKKVNIKAELLPGYFALKYLPCINGLVPKPVTTEKTETIWQFWDNPAGQATPDIVKSSLNTVKKHKGGFDHKILDNSTLGNYSNLPGYVFDRMRKGQMCYAHFSDLLRLNLLKNHGGIWMDATCYMTDSVPAHIVNQDFFVFLTGKRTRFPYSFMQNCFIRAKIGSYLCEAWYLMCVEYWKKETKRIDYFQHQLMFKTLILNDPAAKILFAGMPHMSEDETHRLADDALTEKFDANEWERIEKASFFQKTKYKIKRENAKAADYPNTYFAKLSEGAL